MSSRMSAVESGLNGVLSTESRDGRKGGKQRRKVDGTTVQRAKRASKGQLSARRWVSIGVGGVGCFALALSVVHCSDALVMTTGSWLPLAIALAIAIDCGLVACEIASTIGGTHAAGWARGYVVLAIVLSMVLNAIASGQHAEPQFERMAYAIGAVIPLLVLILFTVASRLWTEG
jgi:hypothetical protein